MNLRMVIPLFLFLAGGGVAALSVAPLRRLEGESPHFNPDRCGDCHGKDLPQEAARHGGFKNLYNALCTECHASPAPACRFHAALPLAPAEGTNRFLLPRNRGRIVCLTCHDPRIQCLGTEKGEGGENPLFLRGNPAGAPSRFCFACHEVQDYLHGEGSGGPEVEGEGKPLLLPTPPSPGAAREAVSVPSPLPPFHPPPGDPFRGPTGLLCLPGGETVVLDGAGARLARFDPAGVFLEYRRDPDDGRGRFRALSGGAVGLGGRLIVADRGDGCLQVLDPKGRRLRKVEWQGPDGTPSRPLGVAVDLEGNRIFVTEEGRSSVRVFRLSGFTPAAPLRLEGGEGIARPRFVSPVFQEGLLYLVEPLEGRVRTLEVRTGKTERIGGLGTGPGFLFRPKGAAVDRTGCIYVADGWTGFISAWDREGRYLGRLAGPSGKPRYFREPRALAFDGRGRLGVVEAGEDGIVWVSPLAFDGGGGGGPSGGGEGRRTAPWPEARCAVCHLDRLPPERRGEGTVRDPGPGSAALCSSCHDGISASLPEGRFLSDTPHGAAEGGGRSRSALRSPENPLEEGHLTCLSCHAAHHGGHAPAPGEGPEHAIHLRFPGPREGICRVCHPEESRDPEPRDHYRGPLDRPFPERLLRLGAPPPDSEPGRITCRTCHRVHGSDDKLLLGRGDAPCRACHGSPDHGFDPHAGSSRFSCIDCHGAHRTEGPFLLLARPGGPGRRCTDCHSGGGPGGGCPSPAARGEERCLLCHAPFGRPGTANPALLIRQGKGGRPRGETLCLSCHGEGKGTEALAKLSHPRARRPAGMETPVQCTTCHDPHGGEGARLVPGVPRRVCARCHGPEGLWRYLYFHTGRRRPRL